MEDFQNILVTIGYPLNQYIHDPYNLYIQSPYIEDISLYTADNVVFLVNYDGKYYALPSWYAGENNGNYYFFINLLNIPSLYNSNFGCNIISIFVGFSNESLLPYLNGTIGGAPEALDPYDPALAIEYDNGLNVFPIYVNFYPYSENVVEEQEISCNNGFKACFINNQSSDVLPTYNNISIYVNGSQYDNEVGVFYEGPLSIQTIVNGPLQGLLMDNGTWQGSYALITSNVLQNTFNQLSQSQNGLGLQTFAYFSGIPWEDSPLPPEGGCYPEVADAVVLSYVSSYNGQVHADTVYDYDKYDYETASPGNKHIGINVGGDTYLPLNFPIFMYEYGWGATNVYLGCSLLPGCLPGYYVGILQYNNTPGLGYFLTTQYTNNPSSSPYWDYYYSGSAGYNLTGRNIKYYFLEDSPGNIQGYNGGSNYFAFMPPDQQSNSYYSQYGVFWLYNWFQPAENNNMNIYFLMNGNIFNYSLALNSWNGGSAYAIPPNPPGIVFCPLNTGECEPIFVQSYINAYNTAFNQQNNSNYQKALNNYNGFTYSEVNSNFVPGTFGYYEYYASSSQSLTISYLQDEESVYVGTPCLFVSAGSGGGSGFMYLDWIIVTYGVPYVISIS